MRAYVDEPAAPDFLPATDWPAACSLRTKQLMDSRNATLAAAGVTLGYPDRWSPANTFERARAGLDEIVTWVR